MANLPIDVNLTRLIVFGQILGIYESCLIIGFIISNFFIYLLTIQIYSICHVREKFAVYSFQRAP
jgi:hypothetical protein